MKPVETMTDAEVRAELAAEGVDVDAAKARFMPKLDDMMRARAVRLALAAVRIIRCRLTAHRLGPPTPTYGAERSGCR